MKFIAHRGNILGPNVEYENTPGYILSAIDSGYDVEVDVWYINGKIMLGHDEPTHETTLDFLQRDEIWAHAKNLPSLEYLLNNTVHCFWHENDERTLTSRNYIWTYPDKDTVPNSVLVVLTEHLNLKDKNIYAVCGDYIETWKS